MPSSHSRLELWFQRLFVSIKIDARWTFSLSCKTYLLICCWIFQKSFESEGFEVRGIALILLFFTGRMRLFFSFNPIQTWQPFCHLLLHFADSPEITHNGIWNWYEEFCDFIPSTHLKKEICPFASMNLHKNAKKSPF